MRTNIYAAKRVRMSFPATSIADDSLSVDSTDSADLSPRLQQDAREREIANAELANAELAGLRNPITADLDAPLANLYQLMQDELQTQVDARVACASLASFDLHRKHEGQIADLSAAYTQLEGKYDALNEAFVLANARPRPAKRWSIFSSAEPDAPVAAPIPTSPTLALFQRRQENSPVASQARWS
jgi:hypothetical protein